MALALITGATGVIGQGIAKALARDGWTLALADRDLGAVQKLAASYKGAHAFASDLTNTAGVDALVAKVEAVAPIEALVNATGGFAASGQTLKPFLEQTPADWRVALDADVYPTLDMSRAVVLRMMARKRGVIVNISSTAGLRGAPQANAYSAARAGVQLFTNYMAEDCGRHGVRMNCVIACETDLVMADSSGVPTAPPLGMGDVPRDVAEAIAFLVSDRASHTTGSLLDVSGGWALY